jgi:hypothetical protein
MADGFNDLDAYFDENIAAQSAPEQAPVASPVASGGFDDLDAFFEENIASQQPQAQVSPAPEQAPVSGFDDLDAFFEENINVAEIPTEPAPLSEAAQQLRSKNLEGISTAGKIRSARTQPVVEGETTDTPMTSAIRRGRKEVVALRLAGNEDEAIEKEDRVKRLIDQRNTIQGLEGEARQSEAVAEAGGRIGFGLKSVLGGATFGLSDIGVKQLEKALDIKLDPSTKTDAVLGSITRLLSGVVSGGQIANSGAMQTLVSKIGAEGAKAALTTRAILTGGISLTNNASQVINGDKSLTDGLRDTSIGFLSSMAGVAPEALIRNPYMNAVGQLLTDFAIDLSADALLTDRVKDAGFMDWLLTQELPNLVGSAVFAGQDLARGIRTPGDFEVNRVKLKEELFKNLKSDIAKHDAGEAVPSATGKLVSPEESAKSQIKGEVEVDKIVANKPADPELRAVETQLTESFKKQFGATTDEAERRARTLLTKTQEQADVPEDTKVRLRDLDPQDYEVVKNADVMASARSEVEGNIEAVAARLDTTEPASAERTALAVALRDQYRADGNTEAEANLTIKMDEELRAAGQGIQAARMWYKSSPEAVKRSAEKMLKQEGVEVTKEVDAEMGRLAEEIAKAPEGSKEKAEAVDAMMDFAVNNLPWKARAGSMFDQIRINNMLSGPRSTARNLYSNFIQATITRPLSLIGKGKIKDVPTWMKDAAQQVPEAFANAVKAYEEGQNQASKNNEFIGKSAMDIAKSKKTPKAFSMFTRFMEAQDVFFSSIIKTAEGNMLLRDGVKPDVAQRKAQNIADEYLFRKQIGRDVKEGQQGKQRVKELRADLKAAKAEGDTAAVKDIRDKIKLATQDIDALLVRGIDNLALGIDGLRKRPGALGKTAGLFMPFLRTPFNVAKQGVKATPLGFIGGGNKETRGMATVGSMVTVMGALAAMNGQTTWGPPKDAESRRKFYASGRKPYSIQIGNKHIPLWYFGPYAFSLAIPAAARDALEDNPELAGTKWYTRMNSIAKNLARFYSEQTPMAGLNGFIKAISGDEDQTGEKALGFTAGQFIPMSGMVRWVNNWIDPTYRKASTFGDSMKRDIPILSKQLDAHLDENDDPAMRTLGDITLPWSVGTTNPTAEKLFQDAKQEAKARKGSIVQAREMIDEFKKGQINEQDLNVFLHSLPPKTMKAIRSTVGRELKEAKKQRKVRGL